MCSCSFIVMLPIKNFWRNVANIQVFTKVKSFIIKQAAL